MNRGFGAAPNKAMPSNPKYANVTSKLTTGPNVRNVAVKSTRTPQEKQYYQRLKATTLARLLGPLVNGLESIYELGQMGANDDGRSVVSSVAPTAQAGGVGDHNFVMYDLRPFTEYEQCHVHFSKHLEVAMIGRSTNNMPHETYRLKGPVESNKMVVLISETGREVREIANTFVERGVENTYVVDGGFLTLCAVCPELLEGNPPSGADLAMKMKSFSLKVPTGSSSGRSEAGQTDRCSTAYSAVSHRTQNTNFTGMGGGSPGSRSSGRLAGAWK